MSQRSHWEVSTFTCKSFYVYAKAYNSGGRQVVGDSVGETKQALTSK